MAEVGAGELGLEGAGCFAAGGFRGFDISAGALGDADCFLCAFEGTDVRFAFRLGGAERRAGAGNVSASALRLAKPTLSGRHLV